MRIKNYRERLVRHVQELEELDEERRRASEALTERFSVAKAEGFDPTTLRVVLKLRRMTPSQRRERRALEAIYMAALGMLDGESLPDEARRRLSGEDATPSDAKPEAPQESAQEPPTTQERDPSPPPEQPPLIQKDPSEARQEGADAGAAGKRIYDNPYHAGDPCRAAWDEGWCSQKKSHGMDVPQAYQRRESPKQPKKDEDSQGRDDERGAA